jgi:hypothetical protein
VRWARNDGRIISYQIETSSLHRPERFCEPWLIEDLSDQLPGYAFVELGKEHQGTMSQIIDILSRSELFVGIDSGMSHIAHSVGVPVFLKHYDELQLCHPNKDYVAFRDGVDLTHKLSEAPSLSQKPSPSPCRTSAAWRRSSLAHLVRRVRRRYARSALSKW